jgi:ABC-type amino acid transport substrate-binding protein
MKTGFRFLISLLCLSIISVGCFYLFFPSQAKDKPIVIGMMSGWAPFMVVNDQGNVEGFDVDVAQEIGKRLGKKVEIKDIGSLASLLLSLDQGTIDFAMSGLGITENRQKRLCMIPYTGQNITSFVLLFNEKIPEGIKNIGDLQRLSSSVVCVEPGSNEEKCLDQFSWLTTKPLSKLEDMVLDVSYGKSLAMFVEPPVAKRLIRQNKQLVSLDVPIAKQYQTFGTGIAFRRGQSDLTKRISITIKQMRNDGTLERMEKQWKLIEE